MKKVAVIGSLLAVIGFALWLLNDFLYVVPFALGTGMDKPDPKHPGRLMSAYSDPMVYLYEFAGLCACVGVFIALVSAWKKLEVANPRFQPQPKSFARRILIPTFALACLAAAVALSSFYYNKKMTTTYVPLASDGQRSTVKEAFNHFRIKGRLVRESSRAILHLELINDSGVALLVNSDRVSWAAATSDKSAGSAGIDLFREIRAHSMESAEFPVTGPIPNKLSQMNVKLECGSAFLSTGPLDLDPPLSRNVQFPVRATTTNSIRDLRAWATILYRRGQTKPIESIRRWIVFCF
jgi:hypothetical protein